MHDTVYCRQAEAGRCCIKVVQAFRHCGPFKFPGHLLALTLKQQETKRAIPFKKLYTSEGTALENDLDEFFLLKAVKSSKKGRTPGIDGIAVELYLKLCDLLGPIWLEVINHATNTGSLHGDLNTTLITVIPKPGKDHLECANYHPISLINADLKIFSKVIAYRMEQVIRNTINPDQTGFLKGRFSSDNNRRLLHILSSLHKIPPAWGLLFLDAEKAFDRLEWTYLWRVLEEFKFGEKCISMIQILYSNPSVRVCVGDCFSELFQIERGSRQGDPLSLLVFNLSIEPLAQLIRSCPQISPITIGTSSHSVSLCADDTLIYMANIQQSLPIVLEKLKHFDYLSGYKVNFSKSALMLVNIDKQAVSLPSEVVTVTETICLGIQICSSVTLTAKNNYLSFLKKF
uniref:Reverse transcriptase domain-containing protein n=1 Tax=Acanthochromis polyacanthus TaxID=80966 RepID=A0A3Q1F781_9TELE